jgi:hypothetical protein
MCIFKRIAFRCLAAERREKLWLRKSEVMMGQTTIGQNQTSITPYDTSLLSSGISEEGVDERTGT